LINAIKTETLNNLYFYRIKESTQEYVWRNSVKFSENDYSSIDSSFTLTDSSGANLYSLILYNANLLWIKLSISDGSKQGDLYKSASHCSNIYSMKEYNTKIILNIFCQESILLIYHTDEEIFLVYKYSHSNFYESYYFELHNELRRVMILNGSILISTTSLDYPTVNTNKTTSSISTVSASDYEFLFPPKITLQSEVIQVLESSLIKEISASFIKEEDKLFSSQINIWTNSVTYDNILHELYYDLDIQIICSTSSDVKIAYSISAVDNYQIPSWANFNDLTGELELNVPTHNEDTKYIFSIDAYIDNDPNPYQKIIIINVCSTSCENKDSSAFRIFLEENFLDGNQNILQFDESQGNSNNKDASEYDCFITNINTKAG